MNKEIFIKYLNNSCSEKEFEELVEWIKINAQNKEDKYWMLEQWEKFMPEQKIRNEKKYDALLDKIHHDINLKQQVNEDKRIFSLSSFSKWISRAAAILFLPLLGVVFYLLSYNNYQTEILTDLTVDSLEVISPIGSRTIVELTDGTVVTLNYGSKIKYPRNFIGNTREIALTGEGYFDVAPNPKKPFIVKTVNLQITALGTEFNVHAYTDEGAFATSLVEGKVLIEKIMPGEQNEIVGKMVPNQHLHYNLKTGEILCSEGNIDKYVGWKEGKMIFDNAPITVVAKELSRKFNVDIEVADDIKDLTYTVTFVDDPLFLILDLMTETTPVKYKRYPRKKLPDGSFSKQKIRIDKR